ncbi:MAG: hypothetical protein AAFO94_17880, partial [Bacteroidota bacterium]
KNGFFIQLLTDRASAEQATDGQSADQLSGPWGRFIKDLLANSRRTKFEPVWVSRDHIETSAALPRLWPSKADCDVRVLGPVTQDVDGQPGLKDLGDTGKNSNGHSICLRVDYGKARLLLTGDLNKKSMHWLLESYGDRTGAWECDVAKACHHGSDDISFRFLEKMHAAATIISSGDAEGHAHPRPEIVGASAIAGFKTVDNRKDALVTPLVYMTEIERSVTLGALNRIDIRNLPTDDGDKIDASIIGRNLDEITGQGFLTPEKRTAFDQLRTDSARRSFLRRVVNEQEPLLEAQEEAIKKNRVRIDFNLTIPKVPFGSENVKKRAWRSRVMEKNHYGLVNVRTDGETIMCATLNETAKKWIIHHFPARF